MFVEKDHSLSAYFPFSLYCPNQKSSCFFFLHNQNKPPLPMKGALFSLYAADRLNQLKILQKFTRKSEDGFT